MLSFDQIMYDSILINMIRLQWLKNLTGHLTSHLVFHKKNNEIIIR